MSSSTCLICCENDKKSLKECSSPECASKICLECLERFVDMALRERTVPRCLSPNCSALFLRSACPTPKYDLALFRGLLRDPELENSLKIQDQQRRFREDLVRERVAFLEASFPTSIRRAVHIMYASDLKRVHKSNLEAMKDQVPVKRCGRVFCHGFMRLRSGSDTWSCTTCSSLFCGRCELLLGANATEHECRAEEIASINLKKTLGECPECHQVIEKSYGCDNMTCAVCGTHFSYTTGERTQQGNHGVNIPVILSEEDGFSGLSSRLLRGRLHHQLSPKEKKLLREIETLETVGLPPPETTEWKPSEIVALTKWTGEEEEGGKEEVRVARSVALRVEHLETHYQESQHFWNRLRRIEDEITILS